MLILGLETTCDETGVAVLRNGSELLANLISSQVEIHQRWGGVAPEVAARCHVEAMTPLLRAALEESGIESLARFDGIAVANRPGLIGALLVGVTAAKALSLVHGTPLVGVNHLEAHLYANFLEHTDLEFPALGLVVSGGHADLAMMSDPYTFRTIGRTIDDAPGEVFDKVARAMGLGYPGGPLIDRMAEDGDPTAYPFPRAQLGDSFNFSFSGLKTALLRFMAVNPEARAEDVAASFQAAVVDALVATSARAAEALKVSTILVAGGVAANRGLRRSLVDLAGRTGLRIVWPRPILCTDNAAMIAVAGHFTLSSGRHDRLDLETFATGPVGT